MIQRLVKLPKNHSFFLFGARGTGKTTLLHQVFSKKDTVFVDLLDLKLFDELSLDLSRFSALINSPKNRKKRVVVDEIQKLPRLLDTIHSQIYKHKRQFVLTGSSSRRLKQKGTNLLAGRAWVYKLYPFSALELSPNLSLKRILELGSFPEAILAKTRDEAREYLNAYVGTYMEKEIQQEGWVRSLRPFRRFLSIAAQMNGKPLNYSKIGRDTGLDSVTIARYFEILEDSLLGFILPAFHHSVRKSQRQAPKFYFVDSGIRRALSQTLSLELLAHTKAFGEAFEQWLILEIVKNASYRRLDWHYSYLRTKSNAEIDLIIKGPQSLLLIEIKSKDLVREEDAKTLNQLGADLDPSANKWLISNDPLERQFSSVRALHWKQALKELFTKA